MVPTQRELVPKICPNISMLHLFHLYQLYIYLHDWLKVMVTPPKTNIEPENHTLEKENHLNQTSILGFQPLVFGGVNHVGILQYQ